MILLDGGDSNKKRERCAAENTSHLSSQRFTDSFRQFPVANSVLGDTPPIAPNIVLISERDEHVETFQDSK